MKFNKKLIPHVYMSKDDFPPGLDAEGVLKQLFTLIEEWKTKLFQALASGDMSFSVQVVCTTKKKLSCINLMF